MQNFIPHKGLYQLKSIDGSDYSSVAKERYEKLCNYNKLRKEGCSERVALEVLNISRATFYRWKKAYQPAGLVGLEEQSRRPHTLRKPCWTKIVEDKVLKIRRKYSHFGKYKLACMLKKEEGIVVSVSTIGRILKKLMDAGKIKPAIFHLLGKFPRNARVFDGHAQPLTSDDKPKVPGDFVQMDHLTFTWMGQTFKSFTAVCPITRIMYCQVYTRATSNVAQQFLQEVRESLTFPLRSIQVDGGSEFRAEFEESCRQLSIPLKVIPRKRPDINGRVERGNGTVRHECYHQYMGPGKLDSLRSFLRKFTRFYNTTRPHQALGYLTPQENYVQLYAEA